MVTLQLKVAKQTPDFGKLVFSTSTRKTALTIAFSKVDRVKSIENGIAKILREIVTKYINHRETIIKKHGGHDSADKRAAIGEIRMKMEAISGHNHISTARHILAFKDKLNSILPGRNSSYRRADLELLETLMDTCAAIEAQRLKIPA